MEEESSPWYVVVVAYPLTSRGQLKVGPCVYIDKQQLPGILVGGDFPGVSDCTLCHPGRALTKSDAYMYAFVGTDRPSKNCTSLAHFLPSA